jgi:hypothetical protein
MDFLGTHMISLVLFFRKPGVTYIIYYYNNGTEKESGRYTDQWGAEEGEPDAAITFGGGVCARAALVREERAVR